MELITGDLRVIEKEAELLRDELCRTQNLSERMATIACVVVNDVTPKR
ncbi:MAG: hypothetical protein HFJ12_07205 [Bacilli bacterium]|nr:hypothetical protein [Bacilli bacterium]